MNDKTYSFTRAGVTIGVDFHRNGLAVMFRNRGMCNADILGTFHWREHGRAQQRELIGKAFEQAGQREKQGEKV